MVGGISCFSRACLRPVIGQCGGYQGNCGQFYCAAHSRAKLCAECAERKSEDEYEVDRQRAMEQLFHKYYALAERVRVPKGDGVTTINTWLVIGSPIICALLWNLFHSSPELVAIPFVMLVTPFLLARFGGGFRARLKRKLAPTLARITRDNPGFDQFYEEIYPEVLKYKTAAEKAAAAQRGRERLGLVLGASLLAVAGIKGAVDEHHRQYPSG